jgi:hypothetical protein
MLGGGAGGTGPFSPRHHSASERATRSNALSKQQASAVEDHKDALRDAEIEETRLETELEKLRGERAALPAAGAEATIPCPHCGGLLAWRQVDLATRVLEKADKPPPAAEIKRRREAIATADGNIGRIGGELAQTRRAVELARHTMQLALDAQARLAKAAAQPEVDIAGAERAHDRARRNLDAFRQKREAGDLAERVRTNDLVLAILAPDGLRGRKLARVVEAFNASLKPLCEAADWADVTVDAAMSLAYGGRPYALLSTSEQYRVGAVLQAAMARLDGSDMIVLDAADVLDGTTRSGLFAMIEESGLASLVCMTLTRREQVPDLAAAELGASYWIEDGIAQPLPQVADAAA